MIVVRARMVEEMTLLAERANVDRPTMAQKILAQGLMVERLLQEDQGLRALFESTAQKASMAEEPKAQQPTSTKKKPKAPKLARPKVDLVDQLLATTEEPPSSPSEPASDTERSIAPSEEPGLSDQLLEAS